MSDSEKCASSLQSKDMSTCPSNQYKHPLSRSTQGEGYYIDYKVQRLFDVCYSERKPSGKSFVCNLCLMGTLLRSALVRLSLDWYNVSNLGTWGVRFHPSPLYHAEGMRLFFFFQRLYFPALLDAQHITCVLQEHFCPLGIKLREKLRSNV